MRNYRGYQQLPHGLLSAAVLLLVNVSGLLAAQDLTQASPVCAAQQLCTCWSTLDPPACYSPTLYHCEDNTRLLAGPEPSGACSVGSAVSGAPAPAAAKAAEAGTPTSSEAQPSTVCTAQGLCTCYSTRDPPACYDPNLYRCVDTNKLAAGAEPTGKCSISASGDGLDAKVMKPKPSPTEKVVPPSTTETPPGVTTPAGLGEKPPEEAAQPAVTPAVLGAAVADVLEPTEATPAAQTPTPAVKPGAEQQQGILLFNDDFTTLDNTKWGFDIGDGSDYGIPGWGNNEFECYTSDPDNAAIIPNPYDSKDGVLRIKTIHSEIPKPCINRNAGPTEKMWTSAKLVTKDLHSFAPTLGPNGCQPVVVESRIKLPFKQGHWSAFWMLPQDSSLGWPKGGELDIMEHINKELEVLGTVHLGNAEGAHMQAPPNNHIPMTSEALQGFNTYKFLWGCDSVSWYVNDKLAYSVQKTELSNWPYDKPFYIILNLAVGGNLPGFDVDTNGGEMLIDYVRVYNPAI